MADYSDLADVADSPEASAIITADQQNLSSLGVPFDLAGVEPIGSSSSYVQRVYDLAAGRWVYYAQPEPNASPAMSETTPPHTGNLGRHQVLYETIPTFTPEPQKPPVLAIPYELPYVDSEGVPGYVQRTYRLPMSLFASEAGSDGAPAWRLYGAGGAPGFSGEHRPLWVRRDVQETAEQRGAGLYAEVPLPDGARVVRVRARVATLPSVAPAPPQYITLSCGLTQIEETWLYQRTAEVGSAVDDTLVINQASDLPWLGPFDGEQTLLVRFTGSYIVAMAWAEVQYLDPGPRNVGGTLGGAP